MWLLLALACSGAKPDDTADTADSADSGDSADSAETGDTAETADTAPDSEDSADTEPPVDTAADAVTVGFDVEAEGAVVGFFPVEEYLGALDEPVEPLFVVPVEGGRAELRYDPNIAHLETPGWAPQAAAGAWAAIAWMDSDGELDLDPGEAPVGVAEGLALYIVGQIPQHMLDAGFVTGWNGMRLVPGGEPEHLDPLAIPLPSNGVAGAPLELGGTPPHRNVASPVVGVVLQETGGTFAAAPFDGDWALTVEGDPPEEARVQLLPGEDMAVGAVVAWDDVDGDGTLSGDEAAYATAADGTRRAVMALWFEPFADPVGAYEVVVTMGARAGWTAGVYVGEDFAPLDAAESLDLMLLSR